MATKTILTQLRVISLVGAMLVSSPCLALSSANIMVILGSNALSFLGGLGLLTSASLDIAQQQTNSSSLSIAHSNVEAVSLLCLGISEALFIVSTEMGGAKLINRIDEVATGMTSVGFILLAAGIWSNTMTTIFVGSILVGSFFVSRALLLPLVIKAHRASFKTSDIVLLGALTIFGNIAGFMLTWGTFDTAPYARHLSQTGNILLGLLNPIVFTGLTINLLRNLGEEAAPWA